MQRTRWYGRSLEFGILGPVAAWSDGRELPLGGAKQRALLAILLLRPNELVPTPRLVDELWGEQPPATAVKTVQVFVSNLRKALGDGSLETQPGGYLLRVAPRTLDREQFELLVEEGRRLLAAGSAEAAGRRLREALSLWRGPPLADFQYETFARNEIGRLDELRLAACELRLEADLALGRHAEVVGELEALVRDHPLRERPRALLMLALYRSGRQADALAVYQETRGLLVDELGLDPGPALQELEKAILRQDVALELERPAPATAAPAAAPPSAQPPEVREGRKTVTVLFCDLVALSADGQLLDPETLGHVAERYFDAAAGTLEHHGGTVEKLVGDELMAVFGVPVVREDDALRAARAAAALRDHASAVEHEFEPRVRLQLRIGVDTGEVVAGNRGGRRFVSGDAVTGAKRLEEAAAVGEILLGEATHALVTHAAEATPADRVALPGNRAAAAFRLDSVDVHASAVPRRHDVPFVGRTAELERLRDLYRRCAAGDGACLATIVGEPGIGKSRLVRELLATLEPEASVLVGRCPPYGEGVTFWPVREVLHQAGRDVELGGPTHEVFVAVRNVVAELAQTRPVVVAFDDVHWAEPTFLDLVEYLATRLGAARVLVLCLTRPQLAEARPLWLQPPANVVVLEPLTAADAELMLEALGAPPAIRARIAETAEGNPLFVEQLAAIAGEANGGTAMPGSIRGVLHERLDHLDRLERAVLERAAVAGRSFTLGSVVDLSPPDEAERVHEHLLSLVRKRLVRPDPIALDEGFRFQHALIRDAAYEGMPKALRAELHERTAALLEDQSADDAVVGYHLEQVFRLRRDLGRPDAELGRQAGGLLRAAGRQAFARGDLPATVSLFERARALLPGDEASRLLPELGEALFEAGRLGEAEEVLDEAIGGAAADPLLEARARVEQQFVRLHADAGATDDAVRVATDAIRVFELHHDDLGLCRAWRLHAWLEWVAARTSDADAAWRRAARHAQSARANRELFEILGWRASATVEGPVPVAEAIRTCTEIHEQVRSSRVTVAVTLQPLAALHAMQGEFDEARSLIREVNAILEDLGRMQSAVSHHEALVELLAGDPAAAEDRLRVGYERLEQMGEKALLATTAAILAEATFAQERFADAGRFCAISERLAPAEDLWTQVIWRSVVAKVLARQGNLDDAEARAREAVELAARTDLVLRHANALLALADVLQVKDRQADAADCAHEALELYTQKGNVVSAAQARSYLGAAVAR